MTMRRFADMTELVVPLDGRDQSVRAVPVAGRLASRLDLPIRLFSAGGIDRWMKDVAETHLDGHTVSIVCAPDADPVASIVAMAGDSGLVCMATAGSLRPHQGHVGSVAEGVARLLGRPIFLVGPDMEAAPGEHTQRVVAPIDGSPLSEAALEPALDIAGTLGVPLWVVTVVPERTENAAEAQLGRSALLAEAGYVRSVAERLGAGSDVDVEFEVLHWNDPARAIVDFAGADGTVVMSTHGRTGLSRLFGGSVTTAVVAHSRRAVAVFRPEGLD